MNVDRLQRRVQRNLTIEARIAGYYVNLIQQNKKVLFSPPMHMYEVHLCIGWAIEITVITQWWHVVNELETRTPTLYPTRTPLMCCGGGRSQLRYIVVLSIIVARMFCGGADGTASVAHYNDMNYFHHYYGEGVWIVLTPSATLGDFRSPNTFDSDHAKRNFNVVNIYSKFLYDSQDALYGKWKEIIHLK